MVEAGRKASVAVWKLARAAVRAERSMAQSCGNGKGSTDCDLVLDRGFELEGSTSLPLVI